MLFIKSLNKTDWQIQIEKPISKIDIIIRYIGRYSKKACLSEHCNITTVYLFTIFDTREPKERTEKFDCNKHKHRKIYLECKRKNVA